MTRLPRDTASRKKEASALVGVVILSLLTFGACSGSTDPEGDFVLTRDQIQVEIDRAGQSEKEFLDDDIITPSERERAYLNFVACAAAKGIEIYDYALDPHGGDSFHSRPIGVQSDAPAVPRDTPRGNESEIVERPTSPEETIVQDCRLEHYTAVGLLYSYNHRLTGAKLAQFNEEVAQCMRDQGVDVPKGATEDQMADIDHWVHSDCFTETRDKYK